MFQTAATFNPPHAQVCVDANKCIAAFIQAEQETPEYLMVAPPPHTLRETGAAGGHEEGGAALAERLFHAAQAERARALSRHSERPAQLEQQHLAAQLEQEHLATSAVLSSNISGVQATGTQQAGQDSAAAGAGW